MRFGGLFVALCATVIATVVHAQQAPTPKDLNDPARVASLVGKEVAVTGVFAYRGSQMGTLGETTDLFGPIVELDFADYPIAKFSAIPAGCKAAPGASAGCKAKITGTLAVGNIRAAAIKVTAIEELK